jgi:probable HAF family extracellular repeat protein
MATPSAPVISTLVGQPSLAYTYTTVDDPLGPNGTYVTAINDSGQIAGYYYDIGRRAVDGTSHGFLYSGGSFTDINDPFAVGDGTFVTAINASGQVAGDYSDSNGVYHGFVYSGGTFTDISDPLAGVGPFASGRGTFVTGINASGQVVGYYWSNLDQPLDQHGFVYSNGTFTDLGPSTVVAAVNASGQLAGYYQGVTRHGFLYSSGNFTEISDPIAKEQGTVATAINDSGQVAGTYFVGNTPLSFVYSNGIFTNFSDPLSGNSFVQAINNIGQVVGYTYVKNYGNHGFVYSNGIFTDTSDPFASPASNGTYVTAINNAGQIAGHYLDGSGLAHGFLATPTLRLVNGSAIELKGTGEAGDTVTLYADGGTTAVGSGTVAADGYFDITTTVTFADGSHTVTATQTDAQGLTGPASASFAFAVGAAVVSVAASPGSGDFNAGNKFTITLDMNEAVKVVGKPTLALNDGGIASYNATLSSPTALVFTYTVAAAQNALELEITGVNLPSGASIKDSQGNNADLSGAVANLGLQIDTTQPTVSNIVASPSTGDLNAGQIVAITLNMSEAVTVLGSPTARLSDGGIATFDAAHSTSTALAFDYAVVTGQNTSDLQLTGVNLPSGAAIQDLAGNKAILSRVTADLGLQIDTKAPTVTKVLASPSAGDLNAGNIVSITLDMSEPVTVKGTPTLALNDGGIATYDLAASTSTSLVFDYLVSAGENTTALQVTGVNLVAGAAIQDLAGNNANLAGGAANLHLTIDTTPPTVSKVVSSPSSGEVTTGHTARIMLDMSEAVTVSGAPSLLLNDGGTATYDAAHSTRKALAFDYIPTSGQVTTDLMVSGIELASPSSIQDLAGNNASLAGGGANLGLGINAKPSGTSGPSGGNLAISGSQELELFGASAANVTLGANSSGILKLDSSATFTGTVAGLASGNYLDLVDMPYQGSNAPSYNSSGPNTGTLAVKEGASTINIALLGNYMANSFVASSDGHGGTVVSEPPLGESQFLTPPHT